jgi:tyrosyl-tRNA synthetase
MKNANFNPNAFNVLKERGFIHTLSHPQELEKALGTAPVTFYYGIDPTAESLHIGNCMGLQVFKILLEHGHNGILLIGNATALIGDPSFKNDMRKMLTNEEITKNLQGITKTLRQFLCTQNITIVHNADWLSKMSMLDFMRAGKYFNIAEMLTHECYKNRIGQGLTMFEMSYMTMQAYDFVHLYNKFGCTLQIGGSDQWGNILAGVELGRKISIEEHKPRMQIMGMCFPLLTKSDGTKMGKTPIEQIEAMESWQGSKLNEAKEILAWELTKDVHGKDEADKALDAAKAVFGGGGIDENMPSTKVAGDTNILDLLVLTKLAPSKAEARRLIAQNGVAITFDGENFETVTDIGHSVTTVQLESGKVVIRKGKKVFHRVTAQHG